MQKKATKKSILKQMERWTSIDLSIIKRIRIINQMHVIFDISNGSYIFLKHTHVHVAFYAWQIDRQSWFNRKYETFTWITSYRCHKTMIDIIIINHRRGYPSWYRDYIIINGNSAVDMFLFQYYLGDTSATNAVKNKLCIIKQRSIIKSWNCRRP